MPQHSFEGYHIVRNSISQLGGQWHPYAWVMNMFGFMLMGISIVSLYARVSLNMVSKILILIFGLSMIGVGFFQDETVYSYEMKGALESNLHSIVANAMGITIVLFALSLVIDKKTSKPFRIIAFLAAFLSSLFSLGVVVFPEYYGLIQRVMFIFIFCWLYYVASVKNRGDNSS